MVLTYTLHYNYVLRHWVFVLLTFVYKLQFIHSKKPSHERNIEIVWRALLGWVRTGGSPKSVRKHWDR